MQIKKLVSMILLLVVLITAIPSYANVDTTGMDDINAIVHDNNVLPPKGFSALTATDKELKMYGIPARPTDKEQLKQWENEMSKVKEYVKLEATEIDMKFFPVYKRNYAGYVSGTDLNTNIQNYTYVKGTWNVPTSVNSNYSTGVWVGLAGADTIVQAGTCDFNPDNGGGYGFWYEDYPESAHRISGLAVKGGDSVTVHITYDPTNKKATYYWQNNTDNKAGSMTVDTPYYEGTRAEYIVENPYWNLYYENFGTVNFSNCSLTGKTTSGGTTSGLFTNYYYQGWTMTDGSGNIKGQIGTASNGAFSVTFKP